MARADPAARFLVNGAPGGCIDPADRGLCLGDGLFETMAVRAGRVRFWGRHMERLARGCSALSLPAPDAEVLAAERDRLVGESGTGSLRLTLTRGPGPRGYALPAEPAPTRVLAFHPGPPPAAGDPLRLRWCDTRLGIQPRLAGLKHLGRLEQILARAEWNDPCIDEGVMQAVDGRVIECTASNLFLVLDGRLVTPALVDCGVAGVVRGVVLETAARAGLETTVRDLSPGEVGRATEAFVTNAARGVAPVGTIGERAFPGRGPVTSALEQEIDWAECA